jgi:hypothetical protein
MINIDINKSKSSDYVSVICDDCGIVFNRIVKSIKKIRIKRDDNIDLCQKCTCQQSIKKRDKLWAKKYWTDEQRKKHSELLLGCSKNKPIINHPEFENIKSILEGCLLGDGCLHLRKIRSKNENAIFYYCSSSKQDI